MRLFEESKIPPGAVYMKILNTTHGSGWIVQVRPTKREAACPGYYSFLANERKEIKRIITGGPQCSPCSQNDPPTAVGGIKDFSHGLCRSGILEFRISL